MATSEKTASQMGGPKGAIGFSIFFITLTYFNAEKCVSGKWNLLRIPEIHVMGRDWLDLTCTLSLIGWFILQCLLYVIPIGRIENGRPLKDNKVLEYRLNALFALTVNLLVCLVAHASGCPVSLLIDKMIPTLTAGVIAAVISSSLLYGKASWCDTWRLNPNGNSGHVFYDWFIGRELNPRIGLVDLKYVMFRSGITGWMLLNLTTVLIAIESSTVSANLLLVFAIQLFYVVDYFWFEEGILVSRDIVHEGLGFNISMQFLMIPFTFCTQIRYIATTKHSSSWMSLVFIFLTYVTGYWIYRASNLQKNNFRKDPKNSCVAHLVTMPTKAGKGLLISGWWGISRHPNYLGDLLISLSYSLSTGFNHFMPYLGFVFLILLLLDREKRDSDECREKYGEDWDKYCNIVKYRIIPYIY